MKLSRGRRAVSGRNWVEEELARKSVLLEATLDHMAQGLVVIDADLKLAAFNQRFIEFRGYPPGFIRLGMALEEIVRFNAERGEYGPGDVEEQVRERISFNRLGKKVRYERAGVDGRIVAFRREPMPGGGSVTTLTDITKRKKAEETLAKQSALLETTFESMAQGIIVLDADLNLVAFNQRYVDLWSYPANFIRLGMPLEEIARFKAERGDYGPCDVEKQVAKTLHERGDGEAIRRELRMADGTVIDILHEPMPGGGSVSTYTDITERKRAEEALRESEERLKLIINSVPVGISYFNREQRFQFATEKYEDFLGLKPSELIGKTLEEAIGKKSYEVARKYAERALDGEIVSFENTLLPKNGGKLSIAVSYLPEIGPDKTVKGFFALVQDVTESKRAEETLRRSEEQFRLVTDAMPALLSYVDANRVYRFVNKTYEQWFGKSRDEILGNHVWDVHGRDGYERLRDSIDEALSGRRVTFETEIAKTTEGFRAVQGELVPDIDGDGKVNGYFVLTTDVTELKQREQELSESEARLVNAQRIARLGNWERDLETGEVHWSDQMYDIFAISPEQFAGTHEGFLERVHPDDRELIEEITRRALSQDAPLDVEYRIVRPDTSERVIHSHGEVEFDAAGKPVRLHGTVQDITERKSLEERIRQIHKLDAVGKLAGGVAHEFNNLLFVIKGNSDLLEARLNGDPELRRYVELISRQTRRGAYLTRLLVAYASQQPLRPKKMNINDVIRETTKLLEGSLSDAIEIDTVCAQDLWTTMVDRGELECAIVNLAVNAQDAMPEGGKLTVETANVCVDGKSLANGDDASSDEYVKLAVTDTGCGMAAVVAERAFEPFFTTKEVGKGSGLGLSMVYGFVNQSGGYVTIDSEPDNGTTVSIYLPKATEAQA